MFAYKLDPALAAYVVESGIFTPKTDSLTAQREAFAEACSHFTPPIPGGVSVENSEVDGIEIRIYTPDAHAPPAGWPTVLYFHGGGWSLGSHTTHDWFAFALLRRAQVAVVSVNYRLAPEHPFPAPLEDGLKVWRALRRGDFPRLNCELLAVAGDSAGGSLAAGLCVSLRSLELPQPRIQVLAYPVLSARNDLNSMKVHSNAPMLTTAGLLAALEGFVPSEEQKADPRAMALESKSFGGVAPAFIGVAEYDPLFDHGAEYAKRLRLAGVPVKLHVGEGLVHASLRAAGVAQVEAFYDAIADSLRVAMLR